MSTSSSIRESIAKLPRGKVFTSARFLELGERGAVDKTLSRLAREGEIERVSRGVFVRPRKNRFIGRVLPGVLEVLEAKTQNTGETLQAHGAEALRFFKLSTQVPVNPVFYTNASSRKLKVGGIEVKLMHTSNRRLLQFAGEKAGLAVSALLYLGKNHVTPEILKQISSQLSSEEIVKLKSASLPVWLIQSMKGVEEAASV